MPEETKDELVEGIAPDDALASEEATVEMVSKADYDKLHDMYLSTNERLEKIMARLGDDGSRVAPVATPARVAPGPRLPTVEQLNEMQPAQLAAVLMGAMGTTLRNFQNDLNAKFAAMDAQSQDKAYGDYAKAHPDMMDFLPELSEIATESPDSTFDPAFAHVLAKGLRASRGGKKPSSGAPTRRVPVATVLGIPRGGAVSRGEATQSTPHKSARRVMTENVAAAVRAVNKAREETKKGAG